MCRFGSTTRDRIGKFTIGNSDKPKTEKYYKKTTAGDDQNHVVKLASEISKNDLDWILTLDAENGNWDMYRKHPNRNRDGSWDYACGLNSYYHKDMISKIKDKSVSEKEILTYCYQTYTQRKTAFNGYKRRFDKVGFKGKLIPRKKIFELIDPISL